jgi:hypothetical protein
MEQMAWTRQTKCSLHQRWPSLALQAVSLQAWLFLPFQAALSLLEVIRAPECLAARLQASQGLAE